MKKQTKQTALRHLRALLRRCEENDFTTRPEDQALRVAIDFLRSDDAGLVNDLWWFIENVTDETPDRTERFFALRERVRAVRDVLDEARAYDARLNDAERVPTADDYNALMAIIGVRS